MAGKRGSLIQTTRARARHADAAVSASRGERHPLDADQPQRESSSVAARPITYGSSLARAKTSSARDEIVVTQLDHDGNVRPGCRRRGARRVRALAPARPGTAELDLSDLDDVGTTARGWSPYGGIQSARHAPVGGRDRRRAHAVGALVYVDGVHYTAHASVDVAALGADFYVCSPVQVLRPHCPGSNARVSRCSQEVPRAAASTDPVPDRELATRRRDQARAATGSTSSPGSVRSRATPSGSSRRTGDR